MLSRVGLVHAKLLQSCPTLHNPMDSSPSGSSVHGTLQARILEWVTLPSSRGSSLQNIKKAYLNLRDLVAENTIY